MKTNFRQRASIIRGQGGLAIVTLVALIAVLIVGPLVLTAYEIVEYNFCQLQLKHCVDAASLAAGCGVTDSISSNVSVNEQYAMNQALYVFQQNSILGHSLADATYSYATAAGPITNTGVTVSANKAALYFEFIDPYTNNQVGFGGSQVLNGAGQSVALNTAGKIIRTIGYFGFLPQFANFLKIQNAFQVTAQADAGLPQLDLVFCFDTSCSLDDFTDIVLVNRYDFCKSTNQSLTTPVAVGQHWDTNGYDGYYCVAAGQLNTVMGTTALTEGNAVNAGYPQEQDLGNATNALKCNIQGHGWTYDARPYYAQSDTNFAAELPTNQYTDLVVPLDGNNCTTPVSVNFTPFPGTSSVFTFPAGMQGVAVLVEAQRYNLESWGVATNYNATTKEGTNIANNGDGTTVLGIAGASGITCKRGWFQAYFCAVMGVIDQQNPLNASLNTAVNYYGIIALNAPVSAGGVNPMPLRHPYGDVICAVENFFQALWNDADVHFGLVVYNDKVGGATNSAGNVADPTIAQLSGTPDNYNPVTNTPILGNPVPGPANYPTPQCNLYSIPEPIVWAGTNTYSFTNPAPGDRTLIPLPQLFLQKTPGSSVSASLFDTTVPPGVPTPYGSVNYALYNYATPYPTCNTGAPGVYPPYCVTPFGGTNLTAAINAAVAQFSSSSIGGGSRLGATPAIVLYTDGVPTAGVDTAAAAATAAAQSTRTAAGLQAIPIYTVGLAAIQAPGFQTQQQTCLKNISQASGIGATSYQVVLSNQTSLQTVASSPWNPTNTSSASQQLDVVFQNIARQLVSLVN